VIFSYAFIPCVIQAASPSLKENEKAQEKNEEKSEEKRIEVMCAVINGKINNPAECNKLQKKILEKRCREQKDPNACKAIEVVKKGVDPDGENLVKISSEAKDKLKLKEGSKAEDKTKAKDKDSDKDDINKKKEDSKK
jgi:hypothetical protein